MLPDLPRCPLCGADRHERVLRCDACLRPIVRVPFTAESTVSLTIAFTFASLVPMLAASGLVMLEYNKVGLPLLFAGMSLSGLGLLSEGLLSLLSGVSFWKGQVSRGFPGRFQGAFITLIGGALVALGLWSALLLPEL